MSKIRKDPEIETKYENSIKKLDETELNIKILHRQVRDLQKEVSVNKRFIEETNKKSKILMEENQQLQKFTSQSNNNLEILNQNLRRKNENLEKYALRDNYNGHNDKCCNLVKNECEEYLCFVNNFEEIFLASDFEFPALSQLKKQLLERFSKVLVLLFTYFRLPLSCSIF